MDANHPLVIEAVDLFKANPAAAAAALEHHLTNPSRLEVLAQKIKDKDMAGAEAFIAARTAEKGKCFLYGGEEALFRGLMVFYSEPAPAAETTATT